MRRNGLVRNHGHDLLVACGAERKEGEELAFLACEYGEVGRPYNVKTGKDSNQSSIRPVLVRELRVSKPTTCWNFNDVADFRSHTSD